jgi:hypothetical protein
MVPDDPVYDDLHRHEYSWIRHGINNLTGHTFLRLAGPASIEISEASPRPCRALRL